MRVLTALGGLIASIVAYLTGRHNNSQSKRQSDNRGGTSDDVYDASELISRQIKCDVPQVTRLLKQYLESGERVPELAGVVRIEVEFSKITPSTIRRRVIVGMSKEKGDILLQSLEREIRWEECPQSVRRDFMRSGKTELAYYIFDSLQPESSPQKEPKHVE